MNFEEWYNSTLASEHTTEKLMASEHGWNACKQEILKLIKDSKIPSVSTGMEGLGGSYYEDMSASDFRKVLINKIKNL